MLICACVWVYAVLAHNTINTFKDMLLPSHCQSRTREQTKAISILWRSRPTCRQSRSPCYIHKLLHKIDSLYRAQSVSMKQVHALYYMVQFCTALYFGLDDIGLPATQYTLCLDGGYVANAMIIHKYYMNCKVCYSWTMNYKDSMYIGTYSLCAGLKLEPIYRCRYLIIKLSCLANFMLNNLYT